MIDIQRTIADYLNIAQRPALLCSFGSDSTLLLHYARQVRRDLPVYYFGDALPELAAQMVIEDDLTVYSFAPTDRYLVPQREQLTLVEEYGFNGIPVPMISPIVKGKDCKHGHYPATGSTFYFPHDLVLWGFRREDAIPLLPDASFDREIQIGHTKMVAPLYDLTTDQVWNALDALGLNYVDNDTEQFCDDCLNAIISSDWDRDAALAGFRSRFNYN